MKIPTRLMIIFVVVLFMFPSSDSYAAIYKYTNEQGQVSIADDLQSIPEQYRRTATIVSGAAEEEEQKPLYRHLPKAKLETSAVSTAPSAAPEPSPVEGIKKSFSVNKVMISILVVATALFAFVVLGILDADHKKWMKIARVVILWGMSTYLIFAHVGDVIHLFRSTKETIGESRQKSVEKGEKAAKALKEMNELMQKIDNSGSPDSPDSDPEKR